MKFQSVIIFSLLVVAVPSFALADCLKDYQKEISRLEKLEQSKKDEYQKLQTSRRDAVAEGADPIIGITGTAATAGLVLGPGGSIVLGTVGALGSTAYGVRSAQNTVVQNQAIEREKYRVEKERQKIADDLNQLRLAYALSSGSNKCLSPEKTADLRLAVTAESGAVSKYLAESSLPESSPIYLAPTTAAAATK
jgi:uncharacterized protein (UPF0335 family)